MDSIKSYNQAIEYIFSLRKPRENYTPGMHLDRLKKFLEFVGNPHNDYDVIHVGGTAGKGSVTYLISKILTEHNINVGTHVSPHLISINEKFQYNLQNCTNDELVTLTHWLKENLELWEKGTDYSLSYYEAIIAMVFKYFSLKKVDVAVIEVGMGGKLDATNVINSQIAVLTNIGLDHMEILGNTKEEILRDKVEIMKPNQTFITGVEENELLEIIKSKAKEKHNQLLVYRDDFQTSNIIIHKGYSTFNFKSQQVTINDIELGLEGDFQITNAALAIETCINYLNTKIENNKVKSALKEAKFPARMEVFSKEPLIVIDGAHNESKARALVSSINKIYPEKAIKLLVSFKKGKNLDLIINELKNLKASEITVTEFEWEYYDKLESFSAEDIKSELEKHFKDIKIKINKEPYTAFMDIQSKLKSNEMLLVTGSLYLIGTLFQKIKS